MDAVENYESAASKAIDLMERADLAKKAAIEACKQADALHAELREKFQSVFGIPKGTMGKITDVIKKLFPDAAKVFAGLSGGGGLAALLADPGGFNGIISTITGLLGG